ncbi:MAG: Phosphoglycerate kinase [Syntrophus sp. PtaU1.Bin005]|jgi:phosphoglycerate kinase|uniref:phosphoglycerate kinase n=1 Tax=Syntrophus buswellii TaxID=43774 RepID=UPI0009C85803|nr:MAG: Phosphoglycerate kinase [Syntrophus sp. PtaB.Bin138]OPY83831.1 MAG: Phosphoglycerate kinase [Syntrophus sp. PtaU1.Bin005]
MITKKTVKDIELRDKRVIMRVDFNVPMKEGAVQDDTRIRAALPTINHVLEQAPRYLILMSHLGDPKKDAAKAKEKAEKAGEEFDEQKFLDGKCRMKPVAEYLAGLLGRPVKLAPSAIGPEVASMVSALGPAEVLMLENTRFHREETSKDPAEREKMAKELAAFADVYINDAFGTAHRAHASTETIARFVPVAVAGFLMEKEVRYLGQTVSSPQKPFVLVLGGAKVSSKIGVITNLLNKVDAILIGGGMAYTFLKARGLPVGRSMVETEMIPTAAEILKKAAEAKVEIFLPEDHIAVPEFSNEAMIHAIPKDSFPDDLMGVDIGAKTLAEYKDVLSRAKTVIWNGPMGVFEMPNFATGTKEIAKALAEIDAITVVGGGDSVSALKQTGLESKMTHVSTGGGASLEFLELGHLPGIDALNDK